MSRQQDKSKDQTGFSPILHPAPNVIDIPTFDIRQSLDSSASLFFEKFNRPDYQTSSAFRLVKPQNANSAASGSKKQAIPRKHRGNYRKYTVSEKQQAVKQILEGVDAKEISQKYGIPRRNLLRWKKNGCERKEGGGRPTDGEMQLTLYTKIDGKILLNEKDIRAEAKRLSKMSDFKASKGWFCKFSRRFNQWKKQERERRIKQQGSDALLDDKDVFLLPEVSGDSDDDSDSDLSGSTPAKKQE